MKMKLEVKIAILVILALLVGMKIGSMNFYVENCEEEINYGPEIFIYEEEKVEEVYRGPVPENSDEDYFRETGITNKKE